ncbi:unnamed protein product [Ilex paraguariensis]|uniref:Uncharacterized protein n=1 Tax=Ilex paraguariensis TaxID=185542 RepID=A0ABC8T501_9AQUA
MQVSKRTCSILIGGKVAEPRWLWEVSADRHDPPMVGANRHEPPRIDEKGASTHRSTKKKLPFAVKLCYKFPSGGGSSNGAIREVESHEISIIVNSEVEEASIMDAKIDNGNSEFGSKDGAFIWNNNRWSSCN